LQRKLSAHSVDCEKDFSLKKGDRLM